MSYYSDILNRKKTGDKLGDAFSKQADSMRPMNVGQRREQALLRGLGVGLGYDSEREDKLAELEEQYKQMDAFERELKMSVGKSQKIKADNENFFLTNRNDLATMNTFLANGDFEAVDVMAPTLIENYKKITGRNIGNYAYSRDGKIYLDDGTGNAKGQYIAEILQGIIPESEQMNFPELLTYNSKQAVQAKMDEQRLKNEQIRAQIANLNAHGKLYEAQGKEALRKAEIGTLTDKEKLTLKTNITKNRDYVEKEILPKLEANEKVLTLYDKLGNIIKENPNLVGSDYVTKVRRTIGEALGLDPALDYAKMTSIDFEKTLRPILGAQFTEKEGNRILGKYPSIEKNITALKQFLKEERPALIKNIVKQKAMYNAYNKDNSANILDENLLGDLNSEYKNYIYDKYGSEISLEIDNKDVDYKKLNNIKEKLGK